MEIGLVTNYFKHVGAVAIKLSKKLKVGDRIRFEGGGNSVEQEVTSMQISGKDVEEANAGDEVGILVSEKVGKGYKVFKV